MPSRNVLKSYTSDAYYHIYNRGVAKQVIYHDDEDYRVFLNLFKRYLSPEPIQDKKGRVYNHLAFRIELLSYCLMPNHFHILVYLHDPNSATTLLKSVSGAYTTYYNKKYERVGPLFQSRFKASRILHDDYLQHITRYIHMNPKNYIEWVYSSLNNYRGRRKTDWLNAQRMIDIFDGTSEEYMKFLTDYESNKTSLQELKPYLANK